MANFYVTTPLYYVNDRPHLGHAYTTIAADVISRWHRMKGDRVHFLTGTDEHGQKVYRVAQSRGMKPQAHADDMVVPFQKLWERLQITHDDFLRTTETRHTSVVQAVLQHLFDRDEIYAADYEGWYSTTAERFWTEKDLVDGKCPADGSEVEWISERNYFFRMSRYTDQLKAYIKDNPEFLQPQSRRNEVLGYLRGEVRDLCISRPKTRLPWGIPLPFDEDYVTYVWFDALLNYITAIGYHPDGPTSDAFSEHWPATYHIVGKDILTTHAVYWSTMLFALGQRPAQCLYAHGWWKVEGRKMSKSLGNVVDPHLMLDCYGVDAVRYFVLKEVPFGSDGDFAHDAFMTRYNADLANDFGNLAHRALSMTEKWLDGLTPALDEDTPRDLVLAGLAEETLNTYTRQIEGLQFSTALESLWVLIRAGNKYIDDEAPWQLNRSGDMVRLGGVMRRCLEICRIAAVLLSPVAPNKSLEMVKKLGIDSLSLTNVATLDGLTTGAKVAAGDPLFPRMQALPEKIQAVRDAALAAEAAAEPTPKKSKNKTKVTNTTPTDGLITFDAFGQVTMRAGRVVTAERHPDAERLLVLKVDIGESEPRCIVAGIAGRYSPEDVCGMMVAVVTNLKPAKIRGVLSEGMLLAVGGKEIQAMVTFTEDVQPGAVIG